MEKRTGKPRLVRGNVALAEGAVQAGCRCYFGYPITPQNEIPEYLSKRLPEAGGTFLQAESELASINMVLGAAAAGVRVMTSSSSPGISLMQEGLSFLAGSRLPAVVVNVQRSGPGLGGIKVSQGDYFQATRGGGHGDYRTIVLAPFRVQEMFDHAVLAFELADKYRNPVLILADAVIGQMKENAVLGLDAPVNTVEKPWALTGAAGRPPQNIRSMYLEGDIQETLNEILREKYERIRTEEQRFDGRWTEDADCAVVAFGTAARLSLSAVRLARESGVRAGLFRPVTLFPFPVDGLRALSERVKRLLVVELNLGQMIEDVRAAVGPEVEVRFLGRPGGGLPHPRDIAAKIMEW
ncbi:MAG: 3-methyl-2-oxobutanoate dehydrogenase subunit VorB [Candidatus Hydrogenedens sp.]|nr:3-methyl-2-oxobutanoate dehydrogenase subunit VorB [Candidatus Hydrogenedentota bacterium]NLF57435.1 3-methyl-2-oxobutanoate dehydrogenase subunit VorB [Candidatus Hydrogenedens sp.]